LPRDSEPFILNVVRNPLVLYPIFRTIANQKITSTDELAKTLLLSTELVEEGMSMLQILGLVHKQEYQYKVTEEISITDNDSDFQACCLHRIARKCITTNGYGKQAAIMLIHTYLVSRNIGVFDPQETALPQKLDDWFAEQSYSPKGADGEKIRMNSQKLLNWAKLTSYLGILTPLSKKYLVFLRKKMFERMVDEFFKETKRNTASLQDFVNWSSRNFVLIHVEGSSIPVLYSRLLCQLHLESKIELHVRGDWPLLKLQEIPPGRGLQERYNAIKHIQ
jgi:hypothetical protein